MTEKITSLQNSRIKQIVLLQQKSKERIKQNLIVIEGCREIRWAVEAGFKVRAVFYCPELLNDESREVLELIKADSPTEVSRDVFAKIAYREGSDGLVVLATPKLMNLDSLVLSEKPLIIVLEAVEKPGNLGAILRMADAAMVDAILICDPLTDIYNPNVIRSSIGCVFTKQVVTCSTEEAIAWLRAMKIRSFAAALTAKKFYHNVDLTVPSAIVMGTEADGLTEKWLNAVDQGIIIPMLGKHDSLNVAMATAIITYEALRQRGFYHPEL
ncbi:MAG: RNA methyltransferase [Bacteroidota bacterium]|nr:RNA methyltransferase [Bacteroidota bacterium]